MHKNRKIWATRAKSLKSYHWFSDFESFLNKNPVYLFIFMPSRPLQRYF